MAKTQEKGSIGPETSPKVENERKHSYKQEEVLTFPELTEIFEDTINKFRELLEQIDPAVRSKVLNRPKSRKSKNLSWADEKHEYCNEDAERCDEKHGEYDQEPQKPTSHHPLSGSPTQFENSEAGSLEYSELTTLQSDAPGETSSSPLLENVITRELVELAINEVLPTAVHSVMGLIHNWATHDTQKEFKNDVMLEPIYQPPHPNSSYEDPSGYNQGPFFNQTPLYGYPQGNYEQQISPFSGQNVLQTPPYHPQTPYDQGQVVPGPQYALPIPPYQPQTPYDQGQVVPGPQYALPIPPSGNPPPIPQTVPSPLVTTTGPSPSPTKTLDKGRVSTPTRSSPGPSRSTGRLSSTTTEYDQANNEVIKALKDIDDHINYMLKKIEL